MQNRLAIHQNQVTIRIDFCKALFCQMESSWEYEFVSIAKNYFQAEVNCIDSGRYNQMHDA